MSCSPEEQEVDPLKKRLFALLIVLVLIVMLPLQVFAAKPMPVAKIVEYVGLGSRSPVVDEQKIIEDALMRAAVHRKIREPGALMKAALQGDSWKKIAFKHPLKFGLWQAVRRAQRAAKAANLR